MEKSKPIDFTLKTTFYVLWCEQIRKIIVTRDVEKSVQEYNNPDYEFQLLAETEDPREAQAIAERFHSNLLLKGNPFANPLGDGPLRPIKLV